MAKTRSTSRAQRGRRTLRLGQAGGAGCPSRSCPVHGFGSYVAACAEVSVDGNKVKIHRIVGQPIRAMRSIRRRSSGSGRLVRLGLTALFYGECTVKDGAIEQQNLDTYEMMRLAQMPKVERSSCPPAGSGAASASRPFAWRRPRCFNAITAATGKRYRSFPLKNQGLTLV